MAFGGRFFGARMIALKWDTVWMKMSAFNLPFPPFQLGSGYEVEDIDRDEAESLGFQIPSKFTATVKIDLDTEGLTYRLGMSLSQLERR